MNQKATKEIRKCTRGPSGGLSLPKLTFFCLNQNQKKTYSLCFPSLTPTPNETLHPFALSLFLSLSRKTNLFCHPLLLCPKTTSSFPLFGQLISQPKKKKISSTFSFKKLAWFLFFSFDSVLSTNPLFFLPKEPPYNSCLS